MNFFATSGPNCTCLSLVKYTAKKTSEKKIMKDENDYFNYTQEKNIHASKAKYPCAPAQQK